MRFAPRPPGICEPCWNHRVDSWQNDSAFYCAHRRNLVRRRSGAQWQIVRGISPCQAAAQFVRARKKAEKAAARRGIRAQDIDSFMNAQRESAATDVI